mmetsp:Transcript_25845/g.83701  ORF Transcript_25845/g.83701 Transcript_25845/m.83701 type:complete len:281 (+) Transcript_25845:903-1745(+)
MGANRRQRPKKRQQQPPWSSSYRRPVREGERRPARSGSPARRSGRGGLRGACAAAEDGTGVDPLVEKVPAPVVEERPRLRDDHGDLSLYPPPRGSRQGGRGPADGRQRPRVPRLRRRRLLQLGDPRVGDPLRRSHRPRRNTGARRPGRRRSHTRRTAHPGMVPIRRLCQRRRRRRRRGFGGKADKTDKTEEKARRLWRGRPHRPRESLRRRDEDRRPDQRPVASVDGLLHREPPPNSAQGQVLQRPRDPHGLLRPGPLAPPLGHVLPSVVGGPPRRPRYE